MTCTRCDGLSIKEPLDNRGHWWWRCINCGERVDRNILLNRAEQECFAAGVEEAKQQDLRDWSAWFSQVDRVGRSLAVIDAQHGRS